MLCIRHQKKGHLPSHCAGSARCLDEQVIRMNCQHLGVEFLKGGQIPILNGEDGLVIVAHPQRAHPHRVDILRDAPGHAAQELLSLAHGLLLPLPLLHQCLNDDLLLLLAEMHHSAVSIILHTADLHVPGVGSVVTMERLGDGR